MVDILLVFPLYSSCYEKAMIALYFGGIRTRLGVANFQVFQWLFIFFPVNSLLVQNHQAEIIIVKHLSKDATTYATRVGVEPRSYYTIHHCCRTNILTFLHHAADLL